MIAIRRSERSLRFVRCAPPLHHVALWITFEFEAKVVPHNAALQVSAGNGKGHLVFSGLQQCGVELQGALLV